MGTTKTEIFTVKQNKLAATLKKKYLRTQKY